MKVLDGYKTYIFIGLAFAGYGLKRFGVAVPEELLVALVAAAVASLRSGVAEVGVKVDTVEEKVEEKL